MDYDKKVDQWFAEAIRAMPDIDPGLRDMLLQNRYVHPRLVTFKRNIVRELRNVQAIRLTKGRKPAKQDDVKDLVFGLVATFALKMQHFAEERVESDLKRRAKLDAIQEQKDIESTINGKAAGIFEEAGVIVNDRSPEA